jgi:alkylation response protein AidB-like acyl-CoA dehydrogenase
MIMARETARLWMAQASRMAEAEAPDQAATVAFVNLARIAVEEQCLRVIPLVQRSLGIQAMQRGNPAEQLMRDLATYLRQPAGDEVLTSAAAWFVERPGS